MASDPDFLTFVCENIRNCGHITSRKMFGEYALYSDGKVFAFICDNQVFIKPTEAGRAWLGDEITLGQAYPGSKMYFTAGARVEDADWLSDLIRVTLRDLPPPKVPAKKAAKTITKTTVKKAVAKAGPKKTIAKTAAKKAPAKKAVKKVVAKKAPAKKSTPKRTAAKKSTAKKPAAKKRSR